MNRRSRWALVAVLIAVGLPPIAASDLGTAQAAAASVGCEPLPAGGATTAPALESYTAINPQRLVDTRNNIGGWGTTVGAGCTMRVNLASDIPANAAAVSLSMTAISSTRDYFTVYPCASGRPETSNLNTRPGIPTPNLVVAIPDTNREICIFSHGTAHLIIDLAGWWSDGPDRFASIQPTRVYDTRQPGGARLARFVTREVKIPTSVIPDGSTAAVVNLTVDRAAAAGYLTAFPCGQPAPPSSNLNFVGRRGAGGRGDRRARARQHDVRADRHCRRRDRRRHGLLRTCAEFRADCATAAAQWHAHRRHPQRHRRPARPVPAGETRAFDPVALVPGGNEASAVMLNVIAANPRANGYLTIYPCSQSRPEVSSLNYTAPAEATNLATVELASDRTICIYAFAATDVIVDVFGVMAAPVGSLAERISFNQHVFPEFTPAGADYAVACNAGTTSLSMQLDLLPQVTATLDGAPVGSGTITRAGGDRPTADPDADARRAVDELFLPVPASGLPGADGRSPRQPGGRVVPHHVRGGKAANRPAGRVQRDLRQPRCARLVQAHAGARARFQAAVERHARLCAATRPGVRCRSRAGLPQHRLDGTLVAELRTDDPNNFPTDQHDYVELPGGGRAMLSYPWYSPEPVGSQRHPRADACAPLNPGTCPFSATDRIVDGVIREIDANGNARLAMESRFHTSPTPIRRSRTGST